MLACLPLQTGVSVLLESELGHPKQTISEEGHQQRNLINAPRKSNNACIFQTLPPFLSRTHQSPRTFAKAALNEIVPKGVQVTLCQI